MGGSGYDIKTELPQDIEIQVPDYDKFKLDYSIGFTTRGCFRDCGFCIVKEKEGSFKEKDMDFIKHSKVILMDNNFLYSKLCKEKLQYFIDNDIKVCFNQGLDIKLINDDLASLLFKVKCYDRNFKRKVYYFAFDDVKDKEIFKGKINLLLNYIKPHQIMIYILINYNSNFEEDMERIKICFDFNIDPYIQVYNKRYKDRRSQKLSKWINQRIYTIKSFDEFNK